MTPAYAELVASLRSDGEALAAAGRLGLAEPVPTCPGWTVDRLLRHMVRIHGWAAAALGARGERVEPPARFTGDDPVAGLQVTLDSLITALDVTTPGAAAWNWAGPPYRAAWWARRMAAETAVHRWDAQFAHGFADRIPTELAVDFLDEYFEVVLPAVLRRPPELPAPTGVMHLVATDADATWTVTLAPTAHGAVAAGLVRDPVADPRADVSVRAAAVDLLLLLHNRPPQDTLEIRGSTGWLGDWAMSVLS